MTCYNVYEAKTNLSEIINNIESGKEDCVILQKNGVPVAKVISYKNSSRSGLFGCGKKLFSVPENFDDLDITSDFEEDIL